MTSLAEKNFRIITGLSLGNLPMTAKFPSQKEYLCKVDIFLGGLNKTVVQTAELSVILAHYSGDDAVLFIMMKCALELIYTRKNISVLIGGWTIGFKSNMSL